MGIEGLHPLLKSAIHRVDLKSAEFRGTTCAVDTSFLLHRGAYACAGKLAQNESTDRYIQYVTRYVERLLEWHIKPIMVFDGSPLPAKRITNINRSDERERNRLRAQKALASGKTREAEQFFQRAIEITPDMVLNVIRTLRTMGIDVIVAPYEADAQLAYLNTTQIADYVITEDSDLVLFGCHHILFKLDENGHGELFDRQKLDLRREFGLDSFERFRWMCILSGCDYLDNIAGIGLVKAKKIMSKTQVSNIETILKQLPQNLGKLNLRVTDDYIKGFKRAHLTFLHQIVYDPLQRKQVPLNPYQDDIDQEHLKSAGQRDDDMQRAFQHAIGNLNVKTKGVVDRFDPSKWQYRPPRSESSVPPAHLRSIWSQQYAIRSNPFSFASTPVNQQALPKPESPKKIRSVSLTPARVSAPDILSSSAILDMYLPTGLAEKTTTKETSSVEFHTSIIQSIEVVKRPRLFNQFDNDTASRFFSTSSSSQSNSVFKAIGEQGTSPTELDTRSPVKAKRFKRSNTNTEDQSSPSDPSESLLDACTTPSKQVRPVLTQQSANVVKESSSDEKPDPTTTKTTEGVAVESDFPQNESTTEISETSSDLPLKATSPVLQVPLYLRNRFTKQASSRMVRPT